MKKIPTLFQRNHETDNRVRNEVTPGCEWVLQGEGIATRKFDGTCCLVRDGKLYKRYEARYKNPPGTGHPQTQPGAVFVLASPLPAGFEPADKIDPVTLKQPGWVPVGDGPEDRWHREAWGRMNYSFEGGAVFLPSGTYELLGPKIQGNPEDVYLNECGAGSGKHWLKRHGSYAYAPDAIPRDFEVLREYLRTHDIEGIVWHHPDGRMAKIKARDFGLKRGEGCSK